MTIEWPIYQIERNIYLAARRGLRGILVPVPSQDLNFQRRRSWFFLFLKIWVERLENTEGAIKNGPSRETGNTGHKTKKNKAKTQHNIYVRHHYTQAKTNNVNKTWALLQTNHWTYKTTTRGQNHLKTCTFRHAMYFKHHQLKLIK